MALFLVQHGKSLPKEKDPNKGLSEGGIHETERIAQVAKGYGVHVSGIAHSGKTRARQTADIFASALRPEGGLQEISGLNPLDDVASALRPEGGLQEISGLNPLDDVTAIAIDSTEDRMLVGHLPFMERLTAYLITGSIERPVFKFQNSGIVCLNKAPDTKSWVIKWALMPHIG
ncbi:MAG: phosphohistidine phosphatase SixA [Deltaproteobacteria bacterium]|nr:phosphohistidine phosphatase SixA [Deltaproteobacteria bacterium]